MGVLIIRALRLTWGLNIRLLIFANSHVGFLFGYWDPQAADDGHDGPQTEEHAHSSRTCTVLIVLTSKLPHCTAEPLKPHGTSGPQPKSLPYDDDPGFLHGDFL